MEKSPQSGTSGVLVTPAGDSLQMPCCSNDGGNCILLYKPPFCPLILCTFTGLGWTSHTVCHYPSPVVAVCLLKIISHLLRVSA